MSFRNIRSYKFDCNKFKLMRVNQGLSQENIALMCGVSINTISSLERGEFQPRMELYFQLCDAVNTYPTNLYIAS